jgi:hypothetical protein
VLLSNTDAGTHKPDSKAAAASIHIHKSSGSRLKEYEAKMKHASATKLSLSSEVPPHKQMIAQMAGKTFLASHGIRTFISVFTSA